MPLTLTVPTTTACNPLYVFINRWIDPNTDWESAAAVNAIVNDWIAIAEETKDHPGVIGYLFWK